MKNGYKNIFGCGPTGVLITVLLWILALKISTWISIPEMRIAPTFRYILIVLFSIDSTLLLAVSYTHLTLPTIYSV